MINQIMIIVATIIIISMFNWFNELLKLYLKKWMKNHWILDDFVSNSNSEFCLEINLLKNNQLLAKISKISIPTALKWKICVIKTNLKTILDGSWTKKLKAKNGEKGIILKFFCFIMIMIDRCGVIGKFVFTFSHQFISLNIIKKSCWKKKE